MDKSDQISSITLSAQGLCRHFGPRMAVEEVDLVLRRGEVLGLLGPNGAGKTTTMSMLTGNLAPNKGSVSICGIDLLSSPKAAKAKVGYLPETPPLYRDFTVDTYLRLAGRLHGIARASLDSALNKAKERCGLKEVGSRLIGALSKGFQQRVGIAQAIIHNPDVIILDEPTVGLDPIQIREIRSLIRELGGEHSVILSTHILPEVETVCDRVEIMHHGKLVYSDTIAGLNQQHFDQSLVVGFRNSPMLEDIRKIEGVTEVMALKEGLFRVKRLPEHDPTDRLVTVSVERGWKLYQLSPMQTTLEEVFLQLTRGEDNIQ